MPDLSVLIPARQEEWLGQTVGAVLAHAQADTEVIVVLDGAWPATPLPQHPRLTVVYLPESIGQRAATNLAARISTARYVMKLDAHCSVADGFDVELLRAAGELGEDVTQIPAQKNLHVFDRVCTACAARFDQAPDIGWTCPKCQGPMEKRLVWQPRSGRTTTNWVLDADLHFQYASNKGQQGDICDVMTSLGACVFLSRARFWELGGLDESTGSWGQFGQELACKSWLSGGRHVVNRRTWFSHFFRVGGIGFPYPISPEAQEAARRHQRALWRDNRWPGQVRTLRWLVEKFQPRGWTPDQVAALPAELPRPARRSLTAGVVYYSDCRPDARILAASRATIEASGLPIVAVTLQPIRWPSARNIVLPLARGVLTMFRQILAGLEALETDLVFFCEHDVLYHDSHFALRPSNPARVTFNQHVWKVDASSGRALHYRCSQTSGLVAARQVLLEHYRRRVAIVERDGFSRAMGFEPGTHRRPARVDDLLAETVMSAAPNVDVRHDANLTPSRWRRDEFRNQRYCEGWTEAEVIPGWGSPAGRFWDWLADQAPAQVEAVAC